MWNGYFINLDRSAVRRSAIETELRNAGIADRYRRFPALVGIPSPRTRLSPGELGCFLSHHDLLASLRDDQFVHILEDDAVLCRAFRPAMESMILGGHLARFDLIFTSTILAAVPPETIRQMKAAFDQTMAAIARENSLPLSLVDLRELPFAGSDSYFVNPASAAKVVGLLAKGLRDGPELPVDLYLRRCVMAGRLRAACIFPFVTCVAIGASTTITGRADQAPPLHELLRYAFYLDADIEQARKLLPPPATATDARLALLLDIHRRMIGG